MSRHEADALNVVFCRKLMQLAHRDVKAAAPHINLRTAAWVWKDGRQCWEFHGPQNFYWHGRADNAYDARAKGWNKWLEEYTRDRPELEN